MNTYQRSLFNQAFGPLTADIARSLFFYDPDTGFLTWRKPPRKKPLDGLAGCVRTGSPYRQVVYKGVGYGYHRIAWLVAYGKWPEGVIDHINGDVSDNRISNLRDISSRENSQNRRRAAVTSKTGFIGAHPDSHNKKKFRASITFMENGKRKVKVLYGFDSAEMAHQAYLEMKRAYHPGGTL